MNPRQQEQKKQIDDELVRLIGSNIHVAWGHRKKGEMRRRRRRGGAAGIIGV